MRARDQYNFIAFYIPPLHPAHDKWFNFYLSINYRFVGVCVFVFHIYPHTALSPPAPRADESKKIYISDRALTPDLTATRLDPDARAILSRKPMCTIIFHISVY